MFESRQRKKQIHKKLIINGKCHLRVAIFRKLFKADNLDTYFSINYTVGSSDAVSMNLQGKDASGSL